VISGINYLQEFIDQYAQEHDGEYPSYQSVFQIAEEKRYSKYLTSDLIISGEFEFVGMTTEAVQIGYAVSQDRSEYILIGMGISHMHNVISLFGIEILDYETGEFEFPIFRSGDQVPENSAFG
jgi:hypothetical protein